MTGADRGVSTPCHELAAALSGAQASLAVLLAADAGRLAGVQDETALVAALEGVVMSLLLAPALGLDSRRGRWLWRGIAVLQVLLPALLVYTGALVQVREFPPFWLVSGTTAIGALSGPLARPAGSGGAWSWVVLGALFPILPRLAAVEAVSGRLALAYVVIAFWLHACTTIPGPVERRLASLLIVGRLVTWGGIEAHSTQLLLIQRHGLPGAVYLATSYPNGGPVVTVQDGRGRIRRFCGAAEVSRIFPGSLHAVCLDALPSRLAPPGDVLVVREGGPPGRGDVFDGPAGCGERHVVFRIAAEPVGETACFAAGGSEPRRGGGPVRDLLADLPERHFALVVLDLPVAAGAAGAALSSIETLAQIKRALLPHGIVVSWIPSAWPGERRAPLRLAASLARSFTQLVGYTCARADTTYLVAGDQLHVGLFELGRSLADSAGPGWQVLDDRSVRGHLGAVQPYTRAEPGRPLLDGWFEWYGQALTDRLPRR